MVAAGKAALNPLRRPHLDAAQLLFGRDTCGRKGAPASALHCRAPRMGPAFSGRSRGWRALRSFRVASPLTLSIFQALFCHLTAASAKSPNPPIWTWLGLGFELFKLWVQVLSQMIRGISSLSVLRLLFS